MAKEDLNGHRKRLRARFLKTGLRSFAEHEILELLLTLCIPRRDVKSLAKVLLKKFGNIRNILDAEPHQLKGIPGIGEASIICFALIKAFSDYYLQQKTEMQSIFNNNASLVQFWQSRLGNLKYEAFEIAYLDSGYRLLNDGIERLNEGTTNRTAIYPQKILKSALLRGASSLVIAHNHPSGQPKPSQTDLQITQNLQYAGSILSIRLLDHLIITKDAFYSFRQAGFLA